MTRKARKFAVVLSCLVLVCVAITAALAANPVRPMKLQTKYWQSGPTGTPGLSWWISEGNGTHLGKFEGNGTSWVGGVTPEVYIILAEGDLTAADGSTLHFTIRNEWRRPDFGHYKGTNTYSGGTGRFAEAVGETTHDSDVIWVRDENGVVLYYYPVDPSEGWISF